MVCVIVEEDVEHCRKHHETEVPLEALRSFGERVSDGEIHIKEDQAVAKQVHEHGPVIQELAIYLEPEQVPKHCLHGSSLLPRYSKRNLGDSRRIGKLYGQIVVADSVWLEYLEVEEALHSAGETNQWVGVGFQLLGGHHVDKQHK